MSRWLTLALVLASCSAPLTDKQYCTKLQMAWEAAYPAIPQTESQRKQSVDDCLSTIAAKHASGEYDRSVACFDRSITGKGNHAREEYLEFKRCEAAGAPPAGTK
jgi:hypothetical protein